MNQPFEHLKIVELASVLAGPAVGMFFAELGAQVVKVENGKQGGDVTRSWRLPGEVVKGQQSAYFSSVNAGKEHLFFNLSNPTDFEELLTLLQEADVLISNFKQGDAEKFGLHWTFLHQRFPKLIVAALMGFESQPNRVAYDVVVQAETGYMAMNGTPESGPVKMPVALMDLLAAHQMKQGILTALYQRDTKTQKGSLVTCSLERAGISNLANQASNYLMTGQIPQRLGSLHPNIAPYGDTFLCKDGCYVVLAIGSDAQFVKMCQLLGEPALANDNRFVTNKLRVTNRPHLKTALTPLFSAIISHVFLAQCLENHIPAGAIKSLDAVFDSPFAQSLIWEEHLNGALTKRVRTKGFTIDE